LDVFHAALVHSPGIVDIVLAAHLDAALAHQEPLPALIQICGLLQCQDARELIREVVLGTILACPVAVALAEGALQALDLGQPLSRTCWR
jgi:hypothetical protein